MDIDNILSNLYLKLKELSINDRVEYLKSLGFDVSPYLGEYKLSKSNLVSNLFMVHTQTPIVAEFLIAQQGKSRHKSSLEKRLKKTRAIKKVEIMNIDLENVREKLICEPNVNVSYSKVTDYNDLPISIDDFMITFKIYYEDNHVEITRVPANSPKSELLLKYIET